VDAAIALWEVTGWTEESVPVMLAAWEMNRHVRVRVAECLALMGVAGAGSDAAHALRAELASVGRPNAMDGGTAATTHTRTKSCWCSVGERFTK
jgi:hypothetical protein